MRQVLITGVCALLLAAPPLSAQGAAGQKFAFINSQQLFQIAPGRAEAQATFEKEAAGLRAQLQKMSDSLQQLSAQYDKDVISLSPTAKEARTKSLRDIEASFQERAQKLNEQQSQRETDLMQPILETIKKVLEEVRTEGGYSIIFDLAAGGGVAAFDKNLDITDRVMSRLKLAVPKAVAKPATGPAPLPAGVTTKKPPAQ